MNKTARSRAIDPLQEKLRAEKQDWNAKVSAFIDDLIQYKKWINGHNNKFYAEKSKITQAIPNDPATVISVLMSDFQNLAGEGLKIVQNQKQYADSRGKTAGLEFDLINKQASNAFSRLLAKFRGPIFGGNKLDKITNKYRVSLLKVLSGIKDALRDLQVDILFKPTSEFPEIESQYSTLDVKVDELNSIYKSYHELVNPITQSAPIEEDTPASKIEMTLKDIQTELIKATWLPILPKRQINVLNKRVASLLAKNGKHGESNTSDILVEKNLIEHDFEDLKKNIFGIWKNVFPDLEFTSIAALLEHFSKSDLSDLDLEAMTAGISQDLKAKNFKTSDPETLEGLNKIQSEIEYSSKLPVNFKRQTHSLNKRLGALLVKVNRGVANQTDINVEYNLLSVDYKKLLSDTLTLWRKILLNPLKDISSFRELFEKYETSGLAEEDVIDLASGFPNTSKSKNIHEKFNLIVGEPAPTRHFSRMSGDGDRMITLYDSFIKTYEGEFFKDFPLKQYTNVRTIIKSSKDRADFATSLVEDVVAQYNEVLSYFNQKLIEADMLSVPAQSFTDLLGKMSDIVDKLQMSKFANVVTYNIGKQIGALKNKFSLGDKSSGLKLQLSDLFTKHVDNINKYMDILEKRILTPEELNILSKDLEQFFKESETPFKALESSYIADAHDQVDSDSQKDYNRNLKSVLRSKDKKRIRKFIK